MSQSDTSGWSAAERPNISGVTRWCTIYRDVAGNEWEPVFYASEIEARARAEYLNRTVQRVP